jgi:hypothetical protein
MLAAFCSLLEEICEYPRIDDSGANRVSMPGCSTALFLQVPGKPALELRPAQD